MPQPYLYLVDNTHAPDPTLPDLYDGIHDDCDLPPGAAIAMAVGGLIGRASRWSFWIAVGVVIGLVIA